MILKLPSEPVRSGPGAPYVMDGAEIATSLVLGQDKTRAALRPVRTAPEALLGVLEDALLSALQRPPCVVAFSGGRDSSGILAAAVSAARRHGLPLPVAATNRFPSAHEADESGWQEAVVRHLGVEDWVRLELNDEVDLVGPHAARLLETYGVIWPVNTHFLLPLMEQARGGTLLTGVGGDELFVPSANRAALILAGETKPRRGDGRAVALALASGAVRQRALRPHIPVPPWLRDGPAREMAGALAAELGAEPFWWGRSVVEHWWRSRSRLGVVQSLSAAAGDTVVVEHPFMHPDFLRALAGARWRCGFATHAAAMDAMFGDLLPAAVRHRTDKAALFQPFVAGHSRDFIVGWDGRGVDPELVDSDQLCRVWNEPSVDARSYALLQSAWLFGRRVHSR